MKLSAPKMITWWVSLILMVVGLLGTFAVIPLGQASIALIILGYALLALGTLLKGL